MKEFIMQEMDLYPDQEELEEAEWMEEQEQNDDDRQYQEYADSKL